MGSGYQFTQDVAEETDAHGEQFRQRGSGFHAAAVGVFDFESPHAMSGPQVPGLEVIRGHTTLFHEIAIELVEEMGVNANSGCDGEIPVGGLVVEIVILDASEGNAADSAGDGGTGGGAWAEWNTQVVSEGV